jgi:hypothetical protein
MDEIVILADIALAQRIDGFEARGSKAIGDIAQRIKPGSRAFAKSLGRGIAVYSGPNSPANKIIGVGFDEKIDSRMLEEVEREYFDRGSAIQAEVAILACPAFHALLTSRGFQLQGFENVLGRMLTDSDSSPGEITGMSIEIVPPGALPSRRHLCNATTHAVFERCFRHPAGCACAGLHQVCAVHESCPTVSPEVKFLFFGRDHDICRVDAAIIETLRPGDF